MTTITHGHLTLSVPATWRRRSCPERGVVVAARAPSLPASGVRPDLTLRTVPLDHDDGAAWRRQALAELAELLVDFALEDDDTYHHGGPGGPEVRYHRFAHRVGTADVLCDQWAWVAGGTAPWGVALTCSAARVDYPDYCDLFEAVAATVEIATPAATRLAGA